MFFSYVLSPPNSLIMVSDLYSCDLYSSPPSFPYVPSMIYLAFGVCSSYAPCPQHFPVISWCFNHEWAHMHCHMPSTLGPHAAVEAVFFIKNTRNGSRDCQTIEPRNLLRQDPLHKLSRTTCSSPLSN